MHGTWFFGRSGDEPVVVMAFPANERSDLDSLIHTPPSVTVSTADPYYTTKRGASQASRAPLALNKILMICLLPAKS